MNTIDKPTAASTTPTIVVREAAAPRPRWQVLLIRPETVTLLLLVVAAVGLSIVFMRHPGRAGRAARPGGPYGR
jgi:hypothetical protein